MVIEPSHRHLDNPVECVETARGAHGDASPDQRFDVIQFNAKNGNFIGAHAASLAD
jgi:hypothetical protein